MKKTSTLFFISLFTAGAVLGAKSSDYSRYYENIPFKATQPTLPTINTSSCTITDFGAKGDGQTLNSSAFSNAIDAMAKKGGGKVVVPRGIWITGPIVLKSNIELNLEEGALILFSDNFDLYPMIPEDGGGYKPQSPISAVGAENIAITGKGIIDGNGDKWRYRKRGKFTDGEWKEIVASGGVLSPKGDMWFPNQGAMEGNYDTRPSNAFDLATFEKYKLHLRPKMVSLINCKKILLQGVTFQNPPNWNINPVCCEDLTVDGISIRALWSAQNSDAIDVESCNRVLIVNSSFDVGDDAICIKSGKDEAGRKRGVASQNIVIDNCTVFHGHGGFVIGSEMSGGVRDISVKNCTFIGTDSGLRFKTRRGRGGVVENIFIDNINMMNIVNNAIIFELFYEGAEKDAPVPPVTVETPEFRNFSISNITCNGADKVLTVLGLPEKHVSGISFKNMNIVAKQSVSISSANNFVFKDCTITISKKSGEPIVLIDTKNIDTTGLKIVKQ